MKMMNRLMMVASMALIAGALFASSAAAAGAKWNATGNVLGIKGTLTLKKNGGSATTCTFNVKGEAKNVEISAGTWKPEYALPWNPWGEAGHVAVLCSSGYWWNFTAFGYGTVNSVTGAAQLNGFPRTFSATTAPFPGTDSYQTLSIPSYAFTNGSGGTYSSVTLSETQIGTFASGAKLTGTGKVEFYNTTNSTALTLAKA